MEVVSPDGLKPLLAFTAIRLEYGWLQTPITSNKLRGLKWRELRERQLEEVTKSLLNWPQTQKTLHDRAAPHSRNRDSFCTSAFA